MSDSNKPIIVLVAPNGAKKTKEVHPNIPINADELAKEAKNCLEAGASLIHLHVRDDNQLHTLDVNKYRQAISEVRKIVADEMVIQATTEAVGMYEPDEQFSLVRSLNPESTSLALREIIPSPSYEMEAAEFLNHITEMGVFPQYILYSPEEIEYFSSLKNRGIIPAGKSFLLFVLGKKNAPVASTDSYAKPEDLYPFIDAKDKYLDDNETEWAVCAFGGNENDCMLEAVKNGGHVRIGFENNHLLANGEVASDNAALIKQFVDSVSEISDRKIATSQDIYGIFNQQ